MQFPIQPVPTPRATRPLEPPPFVDPAGIIMQAAAMRQHQAALQQSATESLANSFMTAASLAEKRREAQAHEDLAQATMELTKAKMPAELEMMGAHSEYFRAMAKQMGGANASSIAQDVVAGKLSPNMGLSMMGRGAQRMTLEPAVKAINPAFDWNTAQIQYDQTHGLAMTNVGANIQQRMRNYSAALPQLKTLHDMLPDLPQGNYQDLNALQSDLATKSGSRAANAFKTQVSRVLLTLRAASPNGTDAVLDQDVQQLNLAKSTGQLSDSIKLLFKDAVNQRNVLGQQNIDTMSPEEQSFGLYPSAQGFGGLGNISAQDTSPGGGLMRLFGSMTGAGQPKAPAAMPDILGGVRAAKLKRQAQ